jgi:hypothetical protein
MKISPMIGLFSVLALTAVAPGIARADDDTTNPDTDTEEQALIPDPEEKTIGAGEPRENLPPPQSDDDPQPQPASPVMETGGIVKQAGVGGVTAYGRSGVLELGGSANFIGADNFTQLSLNPSIGWFFMDNVQISAILGLSHLSSQGIDATFVNALIEPSLHIPFSDTLFGMLGVGAGLGYVEGPGFGFALAPRIGLNILVGRSGLLTPQFFAQYSTHEALVTPSGTLLAVAFSYGAGLGYTVMW